MLFGHRSICIFLIGSKLGLNKPCFKGQLRPRELLMSSVTDPLPCSFALAVIETHLSLVFFRLQVLALVEGLVRLRDKVCLVNQPLVASDRLLEVSSYLYI